MNKLVVALNGTIVGLLEKSAGGAMLFTYHESWLSRPGARAISLSLPLQKDSSDNRDRCYRILN
ncbi:MULTISPECIES: HipA N-terminal domain-containing protein [Photorhabdus]|uniref:Hipa protein, dna binding regulator n=2 Tax=Photorhabdus asymbiotica TaxID=291112 RepID=B6VME7_PHOAA|nr:HipA N-terminal domain-containing protein [Photorhabdus asymbiotica]RKS58134.1 HipA-like protein [Photorhabdus asymbiotica]CAQ82529.1 hipa protein, dna binding regulator [Photorhabdus asymbiotica]CAR67327.1 hipa protein, dna binding regulator [Photorhabdus asymbiotica subsp. asymbiotica ATCC 43949]